MIPKMEIKKIKNDQFILKLTYFFAERRRPFLLSGNNIRSQMPPSPEMLALPLDEVNIRILFSTVKLCFSFDDAVLCERQTS